MMLTRKILEEIQSLQVQSYFHHNQLHYHQTCQPVHTLQSGHATWPWCSLVALASLRLHINQQRTQNPMRMWLWERPVWHRVLIFGFLFQPWTLQNNTSLSLPKSSYGCSPPTHRLCSLQSRLCQVNLQETSAESRERMQRRTQEENKGGFCG